MSIDFGAALREQPAAPPPTTFDAFPMKDDPFDLAPVKGALEGYIGRIDEMQAQAQAVEIKGEDSLTTAAEMTGQVKKLGKAIEEARKRFVAAPGDYVKSVNGLAKSIMAKLDPIERTLKLKIGDYQHRIEMERRKAEQRAREEAAKLQAKIDAEAKAANVEPVKVEAPVVPKAAPTVRTSTGTAYQHTEWRFEVLEPANVPADYLMVDERKIRQAVKGGVRNIPGVKIFEHTETRFMG